MAAPARLSAFSQITQLAGQRYVHEAFQWLHLQQQRILDWQEALVAVAAPPFGERARAEWLCERFRELELQHCELDSEGNALAVFPASAGKAGQGRKCVLLSAHIDTVFPAGTPVIPQRSGSRLMAPGACDNGAGVAGMLAIAAALQHMRKMATVELEHDILFAGNVGEEGDGDLRGIRYLYQRSPWRERIAANLVLDGAGHEIAVARGLGSRRFRVTITAPGGHSWTDAGTPNPIVLLSRVIARLAQVKLSESPRTTLNVGTIEGGTAVNAVPESAMARFDLRSTDADQLVRLEVELHRAVEDVVLTAKTGDCPDKVSFSIEKTGDRPAGALAEGARMLDTLQAVDRHLGIRTELRVASTDANVPLSLGVEAVSIGAGGDGGRVHSRAEWYDAKNRDLGLRRVLLLLMALAAN